MLTDSEWRSRAKLWDSQREYWRCGSITDDNILGTRNSIATKHKWRSIQSESLIRTSKEESNFVWYSKMLMNLPSFYFVGHIRSRSKHAALLHFPFLLSRCMSQMITISDNIKNNNINRICSLVGLFQLLSRRC